MMVAASYVPLAEAQEDSSAVRPSPHQQLFDKQNTSVDIYFTSVARQRDKQEQNMHVCVC